MTWVLVDVSYLAHRAKYALKDLTYDDYHTGVIFGFLEQLKGICEHPKIRSNRLGLFFDSKKSFRRKAYPNYKKKRQEDRSEEEIQQLKAMHEQLVLLRTKILPDSGFPCYRQVGLESDDLMAMAVEGMPATSRRAVIVTSDGDLYQCISPSVHWYDPGRNSYLDATSFFHKKGIHSKSWGMVKALAGCSSDNVEGIAGVGEKTAVQYLNGFLPAHYARAKAIHSPKGITICNRNKGLVMLPHRKTKPVKLRKPEYNPEIFFGYMERYGIVSYLQGARRESWERFFQKDLPPLTRRRGEKRAGKKRQGLIF